MTDEQDAPNTPPAGHTLGEMLRAARESTGLELIELSRQTAVRGDYLAALEEDRLEDLPEPVYVRNFVKLYAQAVGLDARKALEMYGAALVADQGFEAAPATEAAPGRRRRDRAAVAAGSAGAAAAAQPAQPAQTGAAPRQTARSSRPKDQPRFRGISAWLPSLVLIVLVVGLAVWGFNSTLFRPGTPAPTSEAGSPQSPAVEGPAGLTGPAAEPESAAANSVRLTVTTEPPGARVLVDAFPIEGLTPITGAPVTARESRLIRVELEGHEPFEAPFDLTFDRNLSFVLQEAVEPEAGSQDDLNGEAAVAASEEGTITVSVSDESWLEIYPGTAREGNPHVYTTATPGQTWSFDLPVFVRVGNAAGVSVSVGGTDLGPLGSSGEITGRAFTADD